MAEAVTATTGIAAVAASARSCRSASMPLMPGQLDVHQDQRRVLLAGQAHAVLARLGFEQADSP